MSYLIKPTNVITGATAPGIMSFAERKDEAIADAKSRSRLSAFENWNFTSEVTHIRDNVQSKARINYNGQD